MYYFCGRDHRLDAKCANKAMLADSKRVAVDVVEHIDQLANKVDSLKILEGNE